MQFILLAYAPFPTVCTGICYYYCIYIYIYVFSFRDSKPQECSQAKIDRDQLGIVFVEQPKVRAFDGAYAAHVMQA